MSTHAAAAKAIRAELKKLGIKPEYVRSKSYAGGSSITISLMNLSPALHQQAYDACNKYQAGHFCGMEDIYHYNNSNDDLPKAKYVFVSNNFSEDMQQKVLDVINSLPKNDHYGEFPKLYKEITNYDQINLIGRILRGDDCANYYSKHIWTPEELGKKEQAKAA